MCANRELSLYYYLLMEFLSKMRKMRTISSHVTRECACELMPLGRECACELNPSCCELIPQHYQTSGTHLYLIIKIKNK